MRLKPRWRQFDPALPDLQLELELAVDDLRGDLRLGHAEHLNIPAIPLDRSRSTNYNLFSVDGPHIIHLL